MADRTLLWSNYKKEVAKSLGDFGDDAPSVLVYGLTAEIGEFFDVLRQETIKKKKLLDQKRSELGDILWYIAALELTFELYPSKYTTYLGYNTQVITNGDIEDISFMNIHCDIMGVMSELSESIMVHDDDLLAYTLAKVFGFVFDMCAFANIPAHDCIAASITKITKRHPEGFNPEAPKQYDAEYKLTKQTIKDMGSFEIEFELLVDKKAKKLQGIKIKKGRSIVKFETTDLITGFFNASNYIAEKYANQSYKFNYSPDFRAVLDQVKDKIFSGYIKGEKLISALDVLKGMQNKSKDRTVFLDRSYRPILMNNEMKTLDDLLEHVNIIKNKGL
jgi:NTP pyrophosphatase (non-canonical NTP hydrolase)